MRTRLAIAALLCTTSVQAQDIVFGGFADAVVHGEYTTSASPGVATGPIKVGPLSITLTDTSMADAARTLGGTIHEQGEAGEHVVWSCYQIFDSTLWLYSDGEMGDGKVDMVALERTRTDPLWGCTHIADVTEIDLGDLPRLGSPLSEVEARFGPSSPDDDGRFAYRYDGGKSDGDVIEDIVFRIHEGVVVAVAIDQPVG